MYQQDSNPLLVAERSQSLGQSRFDGRFRVRWKWERGPNAFPSASAEQSTRPALTDPVQVSGRIRHRGQPIPMFPAISQRLSSCFCSDFGPISGDQTQPKALACVLDEQRIAVSRSSHRSPDKGFTNEDPAVPQVRDSRGGRPIDSLTRCRWSISAGHCQSEPQILSRNQLRHWSRKMEGRI